MRNVEEDIISATKAQEILNSSISELESLCRKTSLRPRKDEYGNVYFSRGDVDILKKVKDLYNKSCEIRENKTENETININTKAQNIFARAKAKLKAETEAMEAQKELELPQINNEHNSISLVQDAFQDMQNNLIERMESLLSEKMDGLDEVILELIRAKTENENLRQKLNSINKENYSLKKELSSYKPVAFGLYTKNSNQEY